MKKRLCRIISVFAAITVVTGVLCGLMALCFAANNRKDAGTQTSDSGSTIEKPKPMIIWFHSCNSNKLESLRHVLSSGLVTHALILYMHRADADWKTKPEVQKAIEMVKKSDVKLIWCRDLWPYYNDKGIKLSDFYDPNYYIQEVNYLRFEGKQIGADFVALDTEPYGRSIMKHYLKNKKWPSAEEMKNLRMVVSRTVAVTGKVDFVLPAGSARPAHPYHALAGLGNFQISEYTYYDKKRRRNVVRWPNEIFGVYVNVSRENPRTPASPYFLVSDIFERSELWSDSKGVFLYTDGRNQPAVAEALASYAKRLPRKASLKPEESN